MGLPRRRLGGRSECPEILVVSRRLARPVGLLRRRRVRLVGLLRRRPVRLVGLPRHRLVLPVVLLCRLARLVVLPHRRRVMVVGSRRLVRLVVLPRRPRVLLVDLCHRRPARPADFPRRRLVLPVVSRPRWILRRASRQWVRRQVFPSRGRSSGRGRRRGRLRPARRKARRLSTGPRGGSHPVVCCSMAWG